MRRPIEAHEVLSRMRSAVINRAREELMQRRYQPRHCPRVRWGAVRDEGRLRRCMLDQSKTRSGRLYGMRMRLLRRFGFRAFY